MHVSPSGVHNGAVTAERPFINSRWLNEIASRRVRAFSMAVFRAAIQVEASLAEAANHTELLVDVCNSQPQLSIKPRLASAAENEEGLSMFDKALSESST